MHYIYIIQNILDQRLYIGQTNNPKSRWRRHKGASSQKPLLYINRAMAKYGVDNFIFFVIEEYEFKADADRAEIFWIDFFKSRTIGIGFNIAIGGNTLGTGKDHPLYGKTPYNKLFTADQEKDICNKYTNEKLSPDKLSIIYNCSVGPIYGALRRNNIKILGQSGFRKGISYIPKNGFKKGMIPTNKILNEIQEEEICRKYTEENLTSYELGVIYNCNNNVIINCLKRYSIRIKNSSDYKNSFRKFTPGQEKEICEKYLNEKIKPTELGILYSCDRSTIHDILNRNNMPQMGRTMLTDTEKIDLVSDYLIFKSTRKIAEKYNITRGTARKILKENNISTEIGIKAFSQEFKYKILEDYNMLQSTRAVADKYKISISAVQKLIKSSK